jgi:hypothetical protein
MQSSAIPCAGFNIIAEKIHAVHHNLCPVHTSAVAAVAVVCQKVKSLFIKCGGKRKVDIASAKLTPAAKRRSVAITLVASFSLTASLSTPCPPEQGAFYHSAAAMLIN